MALSKTLNPEYINILKRKLYIGYLYFKRYALWFFLALFLLFVLNIVVKNMGSTNNQTHAQPKKPTMIKELVTETKTKIAPL